MVAQSRDVDFITAYYDSAFSIQVPDYLVKVNDLNPQAVLQFSNYFSETYLMVVKEFIFDLSNQSMDSIQTAFVKKLQDKNAQLVATASIIIKGLPARQFEVSMAVGGSTFQYLVTFVLANQQLYKIYSWTLTTQRDLYFNDFKKTALSLDVNLAYGSVLQLSSRPK